MLTSKSIRRFCDLIKVNSCFLALALIDINITKIPISEPLIILYVKPTMNLGLFVMKFFLLKLIESIPKRVRGLGLKENMQD
jgi:hypothetical protein